MKKTALGIKTKYRVMTAKSFTGGRSFFSPGGLIYFFMLAAAGYIYCRQSLGLYLPGLINNYINDFLCMPLVLGLLSAGIRRCKKDPGFHLPVFFTAALFVYYAVYFECYLPCVNPRYTGDWIDVLLYAAGGVLFYRYDRYAGPVIGPITKKS